MVKIATVGSSSSGNGYIIESDDQILILELGCKYSNYLPMMQWNLGFRRIKGCLVSHSHIDHSNPQTVQHFYGAGITIYSNDEAAANDHRLTTIPLGQATMIGGFKVQPFEVEHSVKNYGYLIDCPSGERILFATDCTNIPLRFKNVNIFMVEANYDIDTVIDEVTGGEDVRSGFQNHMDVEEAVRFLKDNYTASCLGVVVIHLSANNSNEPKFIQRIKDELGISNVQAAHSGLTFEFQEDF